MTSHTLWLLCIAAVAALTLVVQAWGLDDKLDAYLKEREGR